MSQTRTTKTFYQKYQDVMPTGAGALFLIQIFSTLGFSVLYSTLILYATRSLHLSDTLATSLTGSFVALNYFLHLLGGYMGGRYLSYRSLFAVGMLLQVIGCALIAIPDVYFLKWGLASFLAGSGLNITCINCMVTQLFEPEDKRRESAFLWNYSGMNIGFFIGFSISGYFHLQQGYKELFLLSSIGNLIALVLTLYHWKSLKDRKTIFIEAKDTVRQYYRLLGFLGVIGIFFALRILLEYPVICNQIIFFVAALALALLSVFAFQEKGAQRSKMWGYLILTIASLIFWTLFQLAPMGLNLFIDRNVDRHFLGFVVAPQWAQNLNTIVIILGGPLLSTVFSQLRDRGLNITIPFQFALALLFIGIGFAFLPLGISLADERGLVSFNWIVVCYAMQSLGELFIAPVGYAMIGQLAPTRLRGVMMGSWMMMIGLAAILSDHFSKMALGSTTSTNPLITNPSFSHTFMLLGWSAIFTGVILFIAVPLIARLTQERKAVTLENLALTEETA